MGHHKIQKRRGKIGMRRDYICGDVLGNFWTTGDKRYVDIFFIGALFAGLQAMLSDMISIVGRVEDIGIVMDAMMLES
jgi:hypothetical protein